ncbi:unnamed protein product [Adineta steineri]|uniref:G-protein coupled receptors family 1 profile domain-containing protein n=1 Tax=Adineta steineri TaxID=433720 RepID=A0A814EL89_9BILA|nr:unnamed protein product [Adineta steineri]CAF4088854.1 unnamed protein product [Adineta steineri]
MLHTIPFSIFLEIRASLCVLSGLLPVLIVSIFSFLAYNNVQRIVRRKLDQQLTAMILIRIILVILLTVPYDIQRMNTYIAKVNRSNELYYAFSTLIGSILVTLFNVSFYIFLIISVRFRRQVRHVLVKKCWGRCKRWFLYGRNQVNPNGNERPPDFSVVLD